MGVGEQGGAGGGGMVSFATCTRLNVGFYPSVVVVFVLRKRKPTRMVNIEQSNNVV